MATTKDNGRGFAVPCLCCNEDNSVYMRLSDLSTLRCPQCDSDYNLAYIEAQVTRWQAVVAWLKTAPQYAEESAA
jgi:hypothetical protein